MPVNHSTPSNLLEILEDLATPSPILLIICIYSATCLATGFLGPQEDAISEVTVFVLCCESASSFSFLGSGFYCWGSAGCLGLIG
jgi:hypothetical protein